MKTFDLAIIGAGPSGLSAAREAASLGLSVALLDENPTPGGRYFRNISQMNERRSALLGDDQDAGMDLISGIRHERITYFPNASVSVSSDLTLEFATGGTIHKLRAERLLLATGGMERPMPLPGWTLPGVMTVGAAEAMLKHSGFAPQNAVMVGSGPLLYSTATLLLRLGYPPKAIVETRPGRDWRTILAHGLGVLRGSQALKTISAQLHELRNSGVRRYVGARDLSMLGDRRVESVHFRHGRKLREIPCSVVLLHHGMVPESHVAKLLGLKHYWNDKRQTFVPIVNVWGKANVTNVWLAGHVISEGGWKFASLSGQIAALSIGCEANVLSREERDKRASWLFSAQQIEQRGVPFLQSAYPPFDAAQMPSDGITVCRCEGIKAQKVRQAAAFGANSAEQVKAITKIGTGVCEGRLCEHAVSQILADFHQRSVQNIGGFDYACPSQPDSIEIIEKSPKKPEEPVARTVHDD